MASRPLEDFPEHIGAYRPERLLGRGGMASVYLCEAPDGSSVAVKWLARATPGQLRRFKREVDALKRVRHAHIVRVLDSGVAEGRPFLVMEHIEGQDLRIYATKLKKRPASERYAEVLRIGKEICAALSVVHRHGLVHRDIKPSNILLDTRNRALLADFGVVRDLDDVEITSTGVLIGTAAYAAPEQLRGSEVDHRADLYSLGCTLYYLLTAEKPYPGPDRKDYKRGHLKGPIPHPSAIDPHVPPALETVIMRLMAKKPSDRLQTARATRLALSAESAAPPPPPLAGRRRYIDAVNACLDKVEQGEARVLRVEGPMGSGRRWLLDVVQDLAGRRGLPLVIAHDSATLGASFKRLRRGEVLALATRLSVPATVPVPVDSIRLEPLGLADVRRSVVSMGPETASPHQVAERLHRATGGHPAWLLPLLLAHRVDKALELPETLSPPPALRRAVEGLSTEALEALGALTILEGPANATLLEQLTQLPVERALKSLVHAGLVVEHDEEYALMGELIGPAALAKLPDAAALHRRAAAAFERRGAGQLAKEHRAAAGDCPKTCDALPDPLLDAETLALQGRLTEARERVERLLAQCRARRDRDAELKALRVLGEILLDQGQVRLAESRLADTVALARALERPGERRYAHVLRASATLENRPGSRTAASAALDRLHRALTKVEAPSPDPSKALALAVRAHAAATLGDRRAWEMAAVAAEAEAEALEARLAVRVTLRLARADAAAGERERAAERAAAAAERAAAEGFPLLVWMGRVIEAKAKGEAPPPPESLIPELGFVDRESLALLQL
ncbi:MAG: serine/threonine protein kinase [Alphaproteobacteria bacterium]|nr:serine/threonine protein kinase [Alphaproteobacteria bacterium]MCB9792778.1 serine/threonine protein kinase [Alphaproteobacteria bacterium]